ncbi:lymphotoxin-alpha-like [Spea bombifrons]|uniref:lymphotoxin-alpha-like n=1 Tax=Spea bombifrons TaxID=233779 RepID=UPI00234AEE78|nr:lymphotoxin-alpha-like [Spea bombifrons]
MKTGETGFLVKSKIAQKHLSDTDASYARRHHAGDIIQNLHARNIFPKTFLGFPADDPLPPFPCGVIPNSGLKIRSKPTKGGKKPAAHFEVDSYKGNTILWRNDTDNAFFQGGLSLKDNKVYIPGNGLYYVYTQATFRGRKCPAQSSISHAVLLQSGPYGQVINLLSAQKTACGEQPTETPSSDHGRTQRWSRSIFQGGIFDLEKGDLLYTTTNGQEYLSWTSGESYLGVYAL